MTMLDPFSEDRRPCKDCKEFFNEEALADEQCFLCWVKEAEDQEDYILFLGDTLDELIDNIIEGRVKV